jgi:hypothetical protein
MNQKERFQEHQLEYAIRQGHALVKSQIWTSLPCKIVSYNASEQSVVVQPLIQGKWRQADNTWVDGDYPHVIDVPVQFPSGGGHTLTFPLKAGDEGTVEFQSRCIDNWWLAHGQASANGAYPQNPQCSISIALGKWATVAPQVQCAILGGRRLQRGQLVERHHWVMVGGMAIHAGFPRVHEKIPRRVDIKHAVEHGAEHLDRPRCSGCDDLSGSRSLSEGLS